MTGSNKLLSWAQYTMIVLLLSLQPSPQIHQRGFSFQKPLSNIDLVLYNCRHHSATTEGRYILLVRIGESLLRLDLLLIVVPCTPGAGEKAKRIFEFFLLTFAQGHAGEIFGAKDPEFC